MFIFSKVENSYTSKCQRFWKVEEVKLYEKDLSYSPQSIFLSELVRRQVICLGHETLSELSAMS